MSPLTHKLVTFIVLPIVLLAHVLCVCAISAAAMPKQTPSAHACCAARQHADPPAHAHDPNCPHCERSAGEALTVADARVVIPDVAGEAIACLSPALLAIQPTIAPALAPHAFTDPAPPPPDVLRATCVLLI